MSLVEHRWTILVAVIVVIAAALYLGNNWIDKKEEHAKEYARDVRGQAQDHRVNQIRKMVEDGGGVYHEGVGVTATARIDTLPLKGSGARSEEAFLAVDCFIQNLKLDQRTLAYRTCTRADFASGGKASLTDNHGKLYQRAEPANMAMKSTTVKSGSVKVNDGITDRLVFEAPTGEIEYLDLRLPAANVGGEGVIEIRIPADKIKRRQ